MQMLSLAAHDWRIPRFFNIIFPLGLSDFWVDQHRTRHPARFQFWRRFLAKVICGAAVARCFYGFGAEICGGSHKGTTRRGRQAGTSRATKLSLCCCCILWSVVCVFMASRAASITCCSLLLIEGGAWPGHRAFLYTYMDLFSAQRAARGGMKKAQSMRAQRPAGALFSPLLGKGVD
jgi:hypothetical protein